MPAKVQFSEEDKDRICSLYEEHQSTRKVANLFGRDRHLIQRVLTERCVVRAPHAWNKKKVNAGFFNELTRESAYFLGLILADGSIVRPAKGNSIYLQVGLDDKDGYLVAKLRDLIAPNHRLIKDHGSVRLHVGDAPLCLNIVQWGIRWMNKTNDLGPCFTLFDELHKAGMTLHFVRGFFDGDGSVFGTPPKFYNAAVSLVGTKPFLTSLQKAINDSANLEYQKSTRASVGSLRADMRSPNLWELRYTGQGLLSQFFNWLYQDTNDLYMIRKHERASDVLKSGELLGSLEEGNQQPSSTRKSNDPGVEKVQRLDGDERIIRPRAPDTPEG